MKELIALSGAILIFVHGAVAQQPQAKAPPDQPAKQIQMISLKQANADQVSRLLASIWGRGGDVNIATDARTNSIIVSATATKIADIENMIHRLDVAAAERQPETNVQIRVVWLVQGLPAEEAREPTDDLKSVLPAIAKLGISKPSLLAQTAIITAPNQSFHSSGLISSGAGTEPFAIQGGYNSANDRSELQISLKAGKNGEICNLSTIIESPIGRFVVLGVVPTKGWTSVFVVQVTRADK